MQKKRKAVLWAGLLAPVLLACEGEVGPFGESPPPAQGDSDPFAQAGGTSLAETEADGQGFAEPGDEYGSTQQSISLGIAYHDLRDGPFTNTGAAYHWTFGGQADDDPSAVQTVCRSGAFLRPFQPYLEKPWQAGYVAMFATTTQTDDVFVAYGSRAHDFFPATYVGPGTYYGSQVPAATLSTLPAGSAFRVFVAHTTPTDAGVFSSHLRFVIVDCP